MPESKLYIQTSSDNNDNKATQFLNDTLSNTWLTFFINFLSIDFCSENVNKTEGALKKLNQSIVVYQYFSGHRNLKHFKRARN